MKRPKTLVRIDEQTLVEYPEQQPSKSWDLENIQRRFEERSKALAEVMEREPIVTEDQFKKNLVDQIDKLSLDQIATMIQAQDKQLNRQLFMTSQLSRDVADLRAVLDMFDANPFVKGKE